MSLAGSLREIGIVLTPNQMNEIFEEIRARGRLMSSTELGRALKLSQSERMHRDVRAMSIKPFDIDEAGLAAAHRETNRARHEALRRRAGKLTRDDYVGSSKTKTKPWEAEGIGRRQWERRQAKAEAVCAKDYARFLEAREARRQAKRAEPKPWELAGVSRAAFYRRRQAGSEIETCMSQVRQGATPWDIAGVSRATFYRRRKSGNETETEIETCRMSQVRPINLSEGEYKTPFCSVIEVPGPSGGCHEAATTPIKPPASQEPQIKPDAGKVVQFPVASPEKYAAAYKAAKASLLPEDVLQKIRAAMAIARALRTA